MLARRKRRPEDEEELLVPHGLIWQATENRMPSQPEVANPEAPNQPAQAIAMPAPPASEQSDRESAGTKHKLGAISPPLPWPSPKIQEIARPARPRFSRVLPDVEPPQFAPPVAAERELAAETSALNARPETASRQILLRRLTAQRDAVMQGLARCRQRTSAIFSSAKTGWGKVPALAMEAYLSSKLRWEIRKAEKHAARQAPESQADAMPAIDSQYPNAERAQASSKLVKVRSAAEHALIWLRAKRERSLASAQHSVSRAADAARYFRVRIKLRRPNSTAVQALLARWSAARPHLPERDSRLWTSMAMAGLSAILALVLFSGLRRYAPNAAPSKVSASTTAPVLQTPVAAPKPSPLARSATSKTQATTVKPASLASALKPAARKVAHPRVRRQSEDDDYVAKNTYVYYGPNGKRSH
jgi:hypothetical protein